MWRDLARVHPGSGGLWRDSTGALVLSATSRSAVPDLVSAGRDWLVGYGRNDLAAQVPRVHVVNYDYAELADMLSAIGEATDLRDVHAIGIDEVKGQVAITTAASAGAASLRTAIVAAGVPGDAFRVDVAPLDRDLSCTNLQAACTPLNGGLRIVETAVYHVLDGISSVGGSVAHANTSSPPTWLGQRGYNAGHPLGTVKGDVVVVVGAYSGELSGTIVESCRNTLADDLLSTWNVCQQGVSGIPADSGDSGATVYVWTGTNAPRAAGILSKKRNESGGGIYFSPVGQVLSSMGYRWFLTW